MGVKKSHTTLCKDRLTLLMAVFRFEQAKKISLNQFGYPTIATPEISNDAATGPRGVNPYQSRSRDGTR
jgi:hypothetical protein